MKYIAGFLAATFLLLACSSSRKATTELNGDWELVMFPAGTKTLTEIFTMKKPELQLQNGQMTGTTGCNRMNGTYTVSGTGIQFGPNIAITKMGCPNYDENVFIEAFTKVNHYQMKNKELILLQDSTTLMTFSKK